MKRLLLSFIILVSVFLTGHSYAGEILQPIPEIRLVVYPPEQYLDSYEACNYAAEEWRKLGLRVKVTPQQSPNPLLTTWFKTHDFEIILGRYSPLPHRMEPDFFTNAKFNSKYIKEGEWNSGEYKNPEFDKLGEEQLKIYDPEKRKKIINRLLEILYEDQPEIVLQAPVRVYAINTAKFDINYVPTSEGIISVWNMPRIYPKGNDKLLKIGNSNDIRTWNPLAANSSNEEEFLRWIYDRLLQVGPEGSIEMWAAESYKFVDDTMIDVKLKKGLKFHDGKPVTIEDVKFSFDYMKEHKAPYYIQYLEPIKETKIIDNDTIRFVLIRPYAPFIMNTLGQVFILPKHIWQDIPKKLGLSRAQDYQNLPLVASGMYKVEYYKEGQEFLLRANPDHFMKPKVDVLHMVLRSVELQVSALKKGTIDMPHKPLAGAIVQELEKQSNIKVIKQDSAACQGFIFHCAKPPFNEKQLRVALAHAVPYERIINEVMMGDGKRAASIIPETNVFWHNKNLKPIEYNLEKARKILKDAGYRWDDKGMLCYPPK